VVAVGDLLACLSGGGLWRWTPASGNWTRIDTSTPASIAADAAGNVLAVFTGGGLWRWVPATGSWTLIDGNTPASIAVDGAGDVLAVFSGTSLWRWTASGGWIQLSLPSGVTSITQIAANSN
jgi:hypothetical protein